MSIRPRKSISGQAIVRAKTFLKCGFSFGLLALLFNTVDWQQGLSLIRDARLAPLLIALAGFPVQIGISSLKWRVLLCSHQMVIPLRRLFVYYWIGSFASNMLPSSVGGDVLRISFLRRTGRLPDVAVSVFVERLSGFIVLLLLSLAAVAARPEYFSGRGLQPMLLSLLLILIFAILAMLLLGEQFSRWLNGLHVHEGNGKFSRLSARLGDLVGAIAHYRKHHRPFLVCLVLSLVFYLIRILALFMVVLSLGLDIPFIAVLCISPLIDLIWAFPLTLNGLGLVEGSFVLFLGRAGLLPSEALAIALLSRFLHVGATSLGGFLWMFERPMVTDVS